MASSSRNRTRTRTRTRKQYRKGKACGGGSGSGSSKRRSRTDKKRKTHKWHQKGCQSGGSSVVGTGSAWHASHMEHQTAGSASAYANNNGNHFSLNTNTLADPQSSNHLVEQGILAGGRKRGSSRKRGRGRGRKHRRFIGEQSGGMIHLLPDTVKLEINNATQMPASAMNVIQGAATAAASPDPTIQPIGRPLLHQV
jgi:hypothetical protein